MDFRLKIGILREQTSYLKKYRNFQQIILKKNNSDIFGEKNLYFLFLE